ncbi:hypothetical protein BASA50_009428 [Batrachochytrium salamandrivorans]|uniref:Mitochondrial import inner membrane translocase subunit n=1 Tax=Batrachochytrium salamandrivorans TaxID=1357716 RepID=A0ABQ8F1M1_9FUNG|nr:hypothetical protein BASA62_007583 [Batrachochytrium salamandrivorans]KAH6580690.1 hypothetical protein BASA60_002761 [Batrachochytrium salamandrivorans]KAH6580696.1 hypothetical protein BASA60_002767 [Batrachochytrium salamandrivorans]KAH6590453.1 hypothetical protein BASA50_009428 [Batrachochytrium salamandrivorans]KAH6594104.1 hypothetical protein BASA61_004093 [Batrachochytrium salamandrivorans]
MHEPVNPEELKQQVLQELAVARFQILANSIVPRCYTKCVDRAGLQLDHTEQACLLRCSKQYQQIMQQVSKVCLSRMAYEANASDQ